MGLKTWCITLNNHRLKVSERPIGRPKTRWEDDVRKVKSAKLEDPCPGKKKMEGIG